MLWPAHVISAGGFVFDSNGNLLVGRHPRRGWDITGGQVENGEDLEQGVLREIREESGVTATVRCLAAIYSNVGPAPSRDGRPTIPTMIKFDFICDYVGGLPTPTDEMLEVLWVPPHRALEMVTEEPARHRLQGILAFDGRVRYCSYKTNPVFQMIQSRYI